MKITIYGIKNCNTMKKAFDKLAELGIDYDFHDYKKQGIDEGTIKDWVVNEGIEKVLNKKGLTWRNLSDDEKTQANANLDYAIDLMTQQPSLIKRPIVAIGDNIIVGYSDTAFEQLVE